MTRPKPLTKKLSKRHQILVDALADPNVKTQTAAGIKAGFNESSARATVSKLLTNPDILAAIEKRKAEMAQYANISADLVFGGTALRATASLDDALDEHGRFSIEKARQTGVIHQIKRIVRTPNKYGESVSIELYGKDAAQDKLGQYLGLEQLPRENDVTIASVQAQLEASMRERGWSDEKIAQLTAGPLEQILGAQELGDAG